MKFGLTDPQWKLLTDLLVNPLKAAGAQVWIFGSRARGKHGPYSDVDILYSLPAPPPAGFIGQLNERLEDSRLPYKIDLVRWEEMAESYKEGVLNERIAL